MTRICAKCRAHFQHDNYVTHDGLIFCLDCGVTPGYIKFLQDISLVPNAIADIGACCGVSTKRLREYAPNAAIIAFEPNKFSAAQIKHADKVRTIGLSSQALQLPLYIHDDPRRCTFDVPNEDEPGFTTTGSLIFCNRLDSYDEAYDFILIDAEGDDHRILYGAKDTIPRATAVMLECRVRPYKSGTEAFLRHMDLLGFKLHGLYDVQTHGLIKFNMGFVKK